MSGHTTWIIIMALLLHIRRGCAVSVLQYSRFASACMCAYTLCVSDCVRVRSLDLS